MKRIFTICLVLLFCASVYATPVGQQNISTAVASVQTDTTALIQLAADQLGQINNAGNVFYVDSSAGGSGTGTSWTNASITIKLGITKYAADNGDVLLVAPGHTESFTTSDSADVTKAGIRIYGLGVGENRPTLTYTTNGEFVIGADDVEIHGFNFIAGNAVVHAIDVEAGVENYVINDCRFWTTSVNTDEFIDCIDIAAGSDNGKITNCQFEIGAAAAVSAISHVGSDFTEISGNLFSGDFSTACIEDSATTSLWMIIKDNILINGDTAGGLNAVAVISLKTETSAIVIDNKIFCDMSRAGSIVAAAGYTSDNSYNGTIGSGTLLEIGKSYTVSMTSTFIDDELFTVAGGPISITSLVGEITTVSQTQANDIEIQLDADNTFDFDFSTAVEITGDLDGDRYVFDDTTTEAVLIPCTGADGGSAGTMKNWYCPPGLILINSVQASHSGNILWYMTFTPLAEGVTVTPM